MSWRDRAEPVAAGGWRSRAEPADEPSPPTDIAPFMEPGSTGRAAALGFSQGGTLGFADEIGGLLGREVGAGRVRLGAGAQPSPDDTPAVRAAKLEALRAEAAQPTNEEMGNRVRDAMRAENAQARAEHPGAFAAGEVGGGAALALLPGGGATFLPRNALGGTGVVGALGRAGVAAVNAAPVGAIAGLGHSEGTTAGQQATDAASGLVASGLTAGALDLAGSGVSALRSGLQGVQNRAGAEIARAAAEPEEAVARQARGALGGEVQAGNRIVENLDRLEPNMTPAQRAELARLGPDAQALRERLASANLRDLPGQVPVINAREAELAQALASEPRRVAGAVQAAQAAAPRRALAAVLPDKAAVAHKAAGLAGGLLGSIFGVGGALAGKEAAEGLAKAAATPEGQFAMAKGLGALLDAGRVPAQYAGLLTQAASRGEKALSLLHVSLARTDPQYLPAMRKAVEVADR